MSQPPIHRATTIVRTGTGDSHVKWNVPARISAPRTASPMMRQPIGISSEKSPTSATAANASSGGSSLVRESSPRRMAPRHGSASVHHRLGGTHTRSV